MAEWLKAHAWKACRRLYVSQVRILSLPPEAKIIKICPEGDLFLLCSPLVSQDSRNPRRCRYATGRITNLHGE